MNGNPVDRFSKERQAIGEGLGRLPGKDGLGTGLWSLDRLWMDRSSLFRWEEDGLWMLTVYCVTFDR